MQYRVQRRIVAMSVVGKDVEGAPGLRVVITEEGRLWDRKANRGDLSGGGSGCIEEVREGGKVSLQHPIYLTCLSCVDC